MVGEYKKVEIGKSRFNVELNRAERECKTKEWNRDRFKSPTKKTESPGVVDT